MDFLQSPKPYNECFIFKKFSLFPSDQSLEAKINRISFEVMCKNYKGMTSNQNNEFLPLVSCQFKSHHVWSPLTDYCPIVTRTSLSCLTQANHLSSIHPNKL